jgi:hypothetical protein
MQPRPPFNRELLIIIVVGLVSILGLVWIFLATNRSEPPIPPTLEPTTMPFEASPVETGTLPPPPPATPTLGETPPTATGTSPEAYPGPPAETLPSASTLVSESGPTPTPDEMQPLAAGRKYDDTDPNIFYDRFWAFKVNSGTAYAYKGTLHISTSSGNEASFRFTGQQFFLGYQRGMNFGIVTVIIDDQPYSFHEEALGNVWLSPQVSPGTHFVRLIHESGESINLDYIEVRG